MEIVPIRMFVIVVQVGKVVCVVLVSILRMSIIIVKHELKGMLKYRGRNLDQPSEMGPVRFEKNTNRSHLCHTPTPADVTDMTNVP
jgi:hypothetical protein